MVYCRRFAFSRTPGITRFTYLQGKPSLSVTRIRKGIISDQINRPEDVQYWKPGFVVPREIKDCFFKRNSKPLTRNFFILMNVEGNLTYQVNKRDGKELQNVLLLDLDETIV